MNSRYYNITYQNTHVFIQFNFAVLIVVIFHQHMTCQIIYLQLEMVILANNTLKTKYYGALH